MEAFKIQFDGEPTSLKMKWKERVMGAPTFLVEQLAYFTGMVKNSMYQERFIELSTFSLYFKQLFWHIQVNGNLALLYISIFRSCHLLILNKAL